MSEPRTVREARLAIREAERAVDRIRMSPASALCGFAEWYLRAAQARLRVAERKFARYDDPREEPLRPLAPYVTRRPSTGRRRRYRCSTCFVERLMMPAELEGAGSRHRRSRRVGDSWERVDCGEWQPVARMPRRKAGG